MGAVKLQESFINEDPPSEEDLTRLDEALQEMLKVLPRHLGHEDNRFLVGIGGTVTTLAAVHLKLSEYVPSLVHGQILTVDDFKNIIGILLAKNLEERKKITGLHPPRADVIIPGAIAFLRCLELMGFQKLIVNQGGYLLAALHLLAKSFPETKE